MNKKPHTDEQSIARRLAGRNVFVTGITSQLGREVCRALMDRGASVTGLIRSTSHRDGLPAGVNLIEGDCETPDHYREALHTCPLVIHIAGMRHASSIVRACAGHAALDRVVFISSTRLHFPDRLLSREELEGKRVLQREEENVSSTWLPWTILRPTLIFSQRDRSVTRLAARIADGRVFPLPGTGRAIRQPISAGDLAVSVVRALVAEAAHRKSYDLPGREITLIDMLNTIQQLVGREVRFVRVPRSLVSTLKMLGALWIDDRVTAACTRYLRWYEDVSRDGTEAARDFGHAPRDFLVNMREQIAGAAPDTAQV